MHKTDKNSSMVVPHAALSMYLLISIYCHRGNTCCAFIATLLFFMNCMVLGSQGKCGIVVKTIYMTSVLCCQRKICLHRLIAFQYIRSLTDQPRPSKLSNCLCLNRLNTTSKFDFGFNGY